MKIIKPIIIIYDTERRFKPDDELEDEPFASFFVCMIKQMMKNINPDSMIDAPITLNF